MEFPFEKKTRIRLPKVLASAQGETCQLETPWCNHDPETTVAAHYNGGGKGMARKADDFLIVYACSDCHRWLDEGAATTVEQDLYFFHGMIGTLRRLFEKQILREM